MNGSADVTFASRDSPVYNGHITALAILGPVAADAGAVLRMAVEDRSE